MRVNRLRCTVRRMMVAVAVIGLALAYAARCYRCHSIANQHLRALNALYQGRPFLFRHDESLEDMAAYYGSNWEKYQRAAIYPWVRVRHRFVPFGEASPRERQPVRHRYDPFDPVYKAKLSAESKQFLEGNSETAP